MRMKKEHPAERQYVGQLAGETWVIRPSDRHRGKWTVWRDGRYYTARQKTLKMAKWLIASVWIGEKMAALYEAARGRGLNTAAFNEMYEQALRAREYEGGGLADSVMALADYCQDNPELWTYFRGIVRWGNDAGLMWPAGWKVVAKVLKGVCK